MQFLSHKKLINIVNHFGRLKTPTPSLYPPPIKHSVLETTNFKKDLPRMYIFDVQHTPTLTPIE